MGIRIWGMASANLSRTGGAIVIAVVAALIAGMLLLLPPGCALAITFVGLVTFLIGAKLHWRWPTAIGNVLMFAGVFASAILGAFG